MVVRWIVVLGPAVVAGTALLMVAKGLLGSAGPTHELRRRANQARAGYHEVLRHVLPGPLHERLTEIGRSVDAAAAEADRVAHIVEATQAGLDSAPAQRLEQLVNTLEQAVVVAGELAVTGHDASDELDLELGAIDGALRELGDPGG